MSGTWDPTPPTTAISVAGGASNPTPPSAAAPVPGTVLTGTPWTTANYFAGGRVLDANGASLGLAVSASSWNAGTSRLSLTTATDPSGDFVAEDVAYIETKNGHRFSAEFVSSSGAGPYVALYSDLVSVAQGNLTDPTPPTALITP